MKLLLGAKIRRMRGTRTSGIAALVGLLCVVSLIGWWTRTAIAAPEEVDIPDVLIMPHSLHFEAEVECETCHEGVAESRSALNLHRPDMEVCADCHDVDDDESCGQCHTNVEAAEALDPPPPAAEKFSHTAHVNQGMDCADCHGDLANSQPHIPRKQDCRACHETADALSDCEVCHAPTEELTPRSHTRQWSNEHGLPARVDEVSCMDCHTQNTCQECHAGDNVRPRSHDLNFAFEHAIQARGNEVDCRNCHPQPEFCGSCHIAARVLPRDHSRAGWVRQSDGGNHAVEGLFDIEACIACHSDGGASPTCARCHGE